MNILFIQSRPSKGGAQHALKRIIFEIEKHKKHKIILLSSYEGWLTNEIKKSNLKNVDVIIEKFPSPRSLSAKLFKNYFWSKKVARKLKELDFTPNIIQANEYLECINTYHLKKFFPKSMTSVFLRNALMKKRDYIKYKCNKIDLKITVSKYMYKKLDFIDKLHIISDGIGLDEFCYSQKSKSIKKILVIGNPRKEKGWEFIIKAFKIMENSISIGKSIKEIHFTGIPNAKEKKFLKSIGPKNIKIVFLKKFDNLAKSLNEYDLIVSPSQKESFGLANVEVLAAGKPLLCSKTGIITEIIKDENFLFEPSNKEDFINKFLYIYNNWDYINFPTFKIQSEIKNKFLINKKVENLLDIYSKYLNIKIKNENI